jgi:hypothetical protein
MATMPVVKTTRLARANAALGRATRDSQVDVLIVLRSIVLQSTNLIA